MSFNPDNSGSSAGQQQQQQQQQQQGHGGYNQYQPQQQGWKSADFNMTTTPSVGRFSNDTASLYMKGSSAKFDDNEGRKTMAPYSNHGQLSDLQQFASSDIVDLRTPAASESKARKPTKPASSNQR